MKMLKSQSKIIEFNDFFTISDSLFKSIGMTPYINEIHGYSLWKNLWFWFSVYNLIFVVIGEGLYIFTAIRNSTNFLQITAIAPCGASSVISTAKMVIIWYNRHKLTDLMRSLKEIYPTMLKDQISCGMFERLRQTKIIMISFSASYIFLGGIFTMIPLVVTAVDYYNTGIWVKQTPFFVWYPFDVYTPYIYEINYILQMWAGFTACIGILGVDILFAAVITQICMQLDVLGQEISGIDLMMKYSKENYQQITKCIQRHNVLISFCIDLENIFSTSILCNFISGCLTLCLVGFQLTAFEYLLDFFKFFMFMIATMLQVMNLCFFGDKIMDRSSAIADCVYQSSWFNGSPEYKKNLILIIQRAQRPQVLTAAKFSAVTLRSFSTVISSSYSYFTLLRTIYEPTNQQ